MYSLAYFFQNETNVLTISQLPKLCKRIEYWCIEYLIFILWVRSFSTRLPKRCSFSLFSVKNAKLVQLLGLTLILTQFPEQIGQIN